MAGTINFAMTQQFDMDGEPLSGGLLYFFQAGTTTPQSAFQDTDLTIPWPNPIELDASGRVPMFYLDDGFIKIRLTDESGVTIIAADQLLVIGPSSGGGGGGGVDATTVLATGDIKARFANTSLEGWVRCNGLTVGNAVSGATERQNADCQALFEYLWSTTVLGVFSGTTADRGTSANADWTAGKRIALPDLRGRTIAGLDDMGTAAASRLTSTYFGTSAANLGAIGGLESHLLTSAQLPSHVHPLGELATVVAESGHSHSLPTNTGAMNSNQTHSHTVIAVPSVGGITGGGVGTLQNGSNSETSIASSSVNLDHTHVLGGSTGAGSSHTHTLSGTTQNNTGGSAHLNVQPTMVMTFFIKL